MDTLLSIVVIHTVASIGMFAAIVHSRARNPRGHIKEYTHNTENSNTHNTESNNDEMEQRLKMEQRNLAIPNDHSHRHESDELPDDSDEIYELPTGMIDVALYRHNIQTQTIQSSITSTIDVKGPIKIYTFGDLEGQLHLLYNMLVSLDIITPFKNVGNARCKSPYCKWNAPGNVYVVQCGDQLDQKRNRGESVHFDLETLIFTDYLQHISGGHFINIIGNHEFMNVYGHSQEYLSTEDSRRMDPNERVALFEYDGIMGKILRLRNITLRINNALFSHGGICQEMFDTKKSNVFFPGQATTMDAILSNINGLTADKDNYNMRTLTPAFEYYAYPKGTSADDVAIMWTRNYKPTKLRVQHLVPKDASDAGIDIMVTGHNKSDVGTMEIRVENNGHIHSIDPSVGLIKLDPLGKLLLVTDTINGEKGQDNSMQYALLEGTHDKLTSLQVFSFSCGNTSCKLFNTSTFKADYLGCSI